MGGEGPAVRFSQDNTTTSFWANRTGLNIFDIQQQEAVYSKARDLFLERGSKLIADYGWQEDTTDKALILNLSKPNGSRLLLPASFASFLETSEADKWRKMFNMFEAKRDRTNGNLFISSPTPLADIFYLLQTLLPGMLLIYRIDGIDEVETERTRALPPAAWVEEHKGFLQTIFGENYDHILAAAADRRMAEEVETISSYWSHDYDSDFKDLTACDKECGYCGACEY